MLKRNTIAVLDWDIIRNAHDTRYSFHPLKFDNGIWDLISATFPLHNIVATSAGYYDSATDLMPISVKGKAAMMKIVDTANNIPPSVALDNVITGVFSLQINPQDLQDQSTGYIFPMYQDVIWIHELELGVGRDGGSERAEELKAKLLETFGSRLTSLFQQCLQATQKLEELGLWIDDPDDIGRQFYLGINGNDIQVLLDPFYLTFSSGEFEESSVEVLTGYMRNMIPSLEFIPTESKVKQFVAYDLPEWKPKSQEEVKRVEHILNLFPRYVKEETDTVEVGEQHSMRKYYNMLDRLMSLICFGYANEVPYEGQIQNFFDTIDRKFVEHYKQMPYDRISLHQLTNYHEIETKYLHSPNDYRYVYNLLITDNGLNKPRPTVPPEDQFYYLSNVMRIDTNHRIVPQPLLKKDEYELDISIIPFSQVEINGVHFETSELIIFYNTQFYDLIVSLSKTGESKLSIPYISFKDLKLIRDLLQGRIMPQTFRDGLSFKGVVFLGGDRTFYQLTYVYDCLLALNSVFSFGKRFVTQLRESVNISRASPESMHEVVDIPRWDEFLRIVKG